MSDWTVKIHEYVSVSKAPTPLRNMTHEIRQGFAEIDRIQSELLEIKGVRGVKSRRDALTQRLTSLKSVMKTMVKAQSERNKQLKEVFFVDEHVMKLAQENYKPTERMLNVMKETSIGALIHN